MLANSNGLSDKSLYSFKTFFDRVTGAYIDSRPTDVILAEVDEAIARLKDGN